MKERLRELATQLTTAELNVELSEERLRDAKKKLANIAERVIPDALESFGLTEFTTDQGERIVVDEIIRASPPAARRAEAMTWLDEHGHGDMIKTSITLAFDRTDKQLAAQTLQEFNDTYDNVKYDARVEPGTLSAWVREQLEQGQPIPMDLFGVFPQKKAKIKKAKKKR